MTFYYHFKDIYDLVEWCIMSDAAETAAGNVQTDTWENELKSYQTFGVLHPWGYASDDTLPGSLRQGYGVLPNSAQLYRLYIPERY